MNALLPMLSEWFKVASLQLAKRNCYAKCYIFHDYRMHEILGNITCDAEKIPWKQKWIGTFEGYLKFKTWSKLTLLINWRVQTGLGLILSTLWYLPRPLSILVQKEKIKNSYGMKKLPNSATISDLDLECRNNTLYADTKLYVTEMSVPLSMDFVNWVLNRTTRTKLICLQSAEVFISFFFLQTLRLLEPNFSLKRADFFEEN